MKLKLKFPHHSRLTSIFKPVLRSVLCFTPISVGSTGKIFVIRPTQFGALSERTTTTMSGGTYAGGFNLDDYQKDQWSASVGVAKKWTQQWSSAFDLSWDSGTGDPASIFNPTKGYWGVGLAIQYSPKPNYFYFRRS